MKNKILLPDKEAEGGTMQGIPLPLIQWSITTQRLSVGLSGYLLPSNISKISSVNTAQLGSCLHGPMKSYITTAQHIFKNFNNSMFDTDQKFTTH